VALLGLMIPFWIIAALVRSRRGDIFYRQERMGLGRQTVHDLQIPIDVRRRRGDDGTGVRRRSRGPRRRALGSLVGRSSVDELPKLWNVLRGDMSVVGPRPERPLFVAQFKDKIPQYMLRHKVKAGITGWAQVNGWRGNTSIEKRIEYDLYRELVGPSRPEIMAHALKGFFHNVLPDRGPPTAVRSRIPEKRVVITGAPASSGSHLAETLLDATIRSSASTTS
jgi:hypothetical protein